MSGRQQGGNLPQGLRYQAFLSYRSTDRPLAEWLHRKLEAYRTPKALVGTKGAYGVVPRRLGRIFMDREDARTSEDVETILAAELASAKDLIVLCSPEATQSTSWVPREIEIFRARRPGGVVHAIIGKGRPPGCFPAPLLQRRADGSIQTPLAADLTPPPDGDGRQRALVKLAAGLLGVPFDALWRRERRRTTSLVFRAACFFVAVALGVAYAFLHTTGAARSKAFAAASAYEFNQGEFDNAAFLALSGLPPEGSIVSIFWPADAERALLRAGQQDMVTATLPPGGNADGRARFMIKRNFLITYSADGVVVTNIVDGGSRERSLVPTCEAALAAGGAADCVYQDFDIDAQGEVMVLALADGSVWRVAPDGAALSLAPPQCGQAWFDENTLSMRRNETCDPAWVSVSDDGAFALMMRRSGAVASFALSSGAEVSHGVVARCHWQMDDDACRDAPPRVLSPVGRDRFAVAGFESALLVFAETGQAFTIPRGAAAITQGPNDDLTVVSSDRKTTTSLVTTYGDELRPISVEPMQEMTMGLCSEFTSGTIEELGGCLTQALTVSPSGENLALAQSDGEIRILRLAGDDGRGIPDERKIKTECLPAQPSRLNLLRPCQIRELAFSPDGVALAALDSEGVVNVFRVDDGYDRSADGAMIASIHLSARISHVVFGAHGDELALVSGSGEIMSFRLPLAGGETRWPVLGTDYKPYRRPQGGALRAEVCRRLGASSPGMTQLSEEQLKRLMIAFPDLGLAAADRAVCEKRGLLVIP